MIEKKYFTRVGETFPRLVSDAFPGELERRGIVTEPDFDQIAREVFKPLFDGPVLHDAMISKEFTAELWLRASEQLRLVWNARGAADITKLEAEFHGHDGHIAKALNRALRTLDR